MCYKTVMPIYEYSCSKCGKTLEVIQKMSDKPLTSHAKCGGKLTKLISAAGFQFKGTGWYVTDYARKGKEGGDSSKESKTESTSSSAETSGKSETSGKTASDTTTKEKPAKSSSQQKSKKS